MTSASITSPPTRCSARWRDDGQFTEETRYDPHSPYSASKAASDHLVRAWSHTYWLAGPDHQLLKQLRSLSVSRKAHSIVHHQGLAGEAMPVYGKGHNVRDWLFVDDHVSALTLVLERGRARRDLQHRGRC